MKLMTRKDTDVGVGEYDSIAWLFETVIREPDTKAYNYAVVHGFHEDSPDKVELFRDEPMYDSKPDAVWMPQS